MSVDSWPIEVSGAVNKPGTLHLEDIISGFDLEERIYRLRCVEAWSRMVPWKYGFKSIKSIAGIRLTEARCAYCYQAY